MSKIAQTILVIITMILTGCVTTKKVKFGDGSKYVGEFKDGKKNGQGTFYYTDGSVYVGELKDGKRNGQGTLTFSDGSTFSDGKKYEGEWKDGNPWNGILYDKKGNILYKIVNGI